MADEQEQDVPDVSIEEATETVVNRMVDYTQVLRTMPVPEKLDWFRKMLVGILAATFKNYKAAQAVVPDLHAFSCWGARNLLELRVIAAYVLASSENAAEFMDDLGADVREFWEAMMKAEEFTHNELVAQKRAFAEEQTEPLRSLLMKKVDEDEKAGPNTAGPAAELDEVRKLTVALGGDLKRKPRQGSVIASLVSESARYGPRYKVLSKVVHPTAMSIAQGITPGGIDALMPLVRNQATSDMLAIFYAIENHVKAHGIGWPGGSPAAP
jgi:hypothetical protein